MIFRGFRHSKPLWNQKDYYKILGIPFTATQLQIKKAYFILAKQYHPDLNKSPDSQQKFTELTTAYQTLIDKQKRLIYDQKNPNFKQKSNFSEFQDQYPFQYQQSQSQNPRSQFQQNLDSQSARQRKNYKGEDVNLQLEVSFWESIKGTDKEVNFERWSVCQTCKGSRTKPGTYPSRCPICKGGGFMRFQSGFYKQKQVCPRCYGTGSIIKFLCMDCEGTGSIISSVKQVIKIPVGIDSGHILRLANKGHQSEKGGPSGDLIMNIQVSSHPKFERKGFDIVSQVPIQISQAVLGKKIQIEGLKGLEYVKIPPGCSHGHQITLKNKGIPI